MKQRIALSKAGDSITAKAPPGYSGCVRVYGRYGGWFAEYPPD